MINAEASTLHIACQWRLSRFSDEVRGVKGTRLNLCSLTLIDQEVKKKKNPRCVDVSCEDCVHVFEECCGRWSMPLGANMCHSHSAKPVTFSLRCVLHTRRLDKWVQLGLASVNELFDLTARRCEGKPHQHTVH